MLSLDISNPGHPREVGRLTLQPDQVPHWIALEPSGHRLVITGYRELAPWVLLANLDRATGALEVDTTFRAPGARASRRLLRSRPVAAWRYGPSSAPWRGVRSAMSAIAWGLLRLDDTVLHYEVMAAPGVVG